jgi:fructose-bisphosphate aldolase class II
MEILQAMVNAAGEMRSPVIIQASEGAIEYAGLEYLVGLVKVAAQKINVPMALHLDHGQDMEVIEACIKGGFTSVMIDGSHLPLKENIALTKNVVEMAKSKNVTIEAELGRLGGIEDKIKVDEKDALLTDPQEAKIFVQESGVDVLAIAVGTSHGAYKFKGDAKLALDRIGEIKKLTNVPLVLHGASGVPQDIVEKAAKYGAKLPGAKGVPDEAIKEAVKLGISKINIDTDLRLSFTCAIREVLYTDPAVFDPRKILGPARKAISAIVKQKMEIFGSAGKA